MKRHGNLFEKIIDSDNLFKAYKAARKGKSKSSQVQEFEKDINGNLLKIQKLLCTKKFTTSKYKVKTIYEPKKREIYILPFFPDRIVQHAILQILIPIWDKLMDEHSYACRTGKGLHKASKKCSEYIRKYKFCLKMDISKFYPSIDHTILKSIIRRKIKCKETLFLLDNIIDSIDGNKNTPIGNYTSQWFGNLYLNEIDQKLRHFYKVKAFLRYCDDILVFDDSKDFLHVLKNNVKLNIKELEMKFSKWTISPTLKGIEFIGYRFFRNYILLRKSTKVRILKRLNKLPKLFLRNEISINQFKSSIFSTLGWIKNTNSFNFKFSSELIKFQEVLT